MTYSDNEGVGHASGRVGDLVTELNPVMVEPTTFDHSNTIKPCNALLREEGSQDLLVMEEKTSSESAGQVTRKRNGTSYVSNNTAHTVGGEDIETVVIVEIEFELSGKIANGSCHKKEAKGGS